MTECVMTEIEIKELALKFVKAESEEPKEENLEEVLETKEVKEVVPEEKVLEIPNIEPIVRDEIPVLRDGEEQAEDEDPKTFDDVYDLLEQIDGKIDIIIRGL